MKKPILLILTCLLLAITGSGKAGSLNLLFSNTCRSSYPVIVQGKVYSDSTGVPISGHAVLITASALGYSATHYSDADGNYSDTIPDVGPGYTIIVATLDCHQVLHSQSFLSIPTPVTINFSICDSPQPVECHAIFYFILDSLNKQANTFRFFDISTGNPDHWFWQFGDGTTSNIKNPKHQFATPGTYQVCLMITKAPGGQVVCWDSVCQSLTTVTYRKLGGHLFAGNFPINNPVSTGDTGLAFLYRVNKNRLVPVDTSRFTELGYYAFPQVLPGNYYLRAELTPGSSKFNQFFPGYFNNSLKWTESTHIDLADSNAYTCQIHLLACPDSLAGPASIWGDVTNGEPGQGPVAIPYAEVLLYNSLMTPVGFTMADHQGRFILSGIPYGNYYLYVEFAGKYSRLTGVSLEPPNVVSDTLHIQLFDHNVTGISDLVSPGSIADRVFPNPADDRVTVKLHTSAPARYLFRIIDMTGRTVTSMDADITAGEATFSISLAEIQPGIYILFIHTSDGADSNIQKFIKK